MSKNNSKQKKKWKSRKSEWNGHSLSQGIYPKIRASMVFGYMFRLAEMLQKIEDNNRPQLTKFR